MSGRYLTDLAAVLRAAGLTVVEYDGWQTRARSSGGYQSGRPVGVWWHHTASSTTPDSDAYWECHSSPDRPISNLLTCRDGSVWVLAAGATNTNGKGGPVTLPGGVTVPQDSANSWVIGNECANNGVGEPWPPAQIDAAFAVQLACAAAYGFRPDDLCTHQVWAPTRKIDPATAAAVQGGWQPASVTSSGTWNLADIRAEALRRAGTPPAPRPPQPPQPVEDDDMVLLVQYSDGGMWAVAGDLSWRFPLNADESAALGSTPGYYPVALSPWTIEHIPSIPPPYDH